MRADYPESGAEALRRSAPGSSVVAELSLVSETEFREVFYSRHGAFDRQWVEGGGARWLDTLLPATPVVGATSVSALSRGSSLYDWLVGSSAHLALTWGTLELVLPEVVRALRSPGGCRVVLELPRVGRVSGAVLRDHGFRLVREAADGLVRYADGEVRASLPGGRQWWHAGHVPVTAPDFQLDLSAAEAAMDLRDQGVPTEPAERRAMRAFLPVPWDPDRWVDTELPAWVESMMREGVRIRPEIEPPPADHPFYRWESGEAQLRAIMEADRHLSAGSLEYIPFEEVRGVAATAIVHPWVVARQGVKWRLCHDYSVGLNQYVAASPFILPTPWDVRPCLKPGSRFAKYDIRDGFFHVPVHVDSRRHLVVRHPGTGRLMWAPRLPFGFGRSPELFCGLMEAIADKLRGRCSGRGIHFFVFVDDWLVVGDDEDLTLEGCSMLEDELRLLGISWAPNKHRGPAEVMEFLGLLLSNLGGVPSISLTRKRRDGLLQEIAEWRQWSSAERREGREPRADPRELAVLLGKLVFSSQVVWNGRAFMQAMLSSFAGCEIDWRRGKVSFRGGSFTKRMVLPGGFWDDLDWWGEHLLERYSVPWTEVETPTAAIMGTDASGWGSGQLAWIDGGREEGQLLFTSAETRRPINWRELSGIVRAVELFGARLSGRTVLMETDNMAAKCSAAKGASHAEDMQELIRRLTRACERHRIRLKLTHTPGLKLDRPDHTSRGDLVEEPRQRLSARVFASLERAWGPFDSFIGPERQLASSELQSGLQFSPSGSIVGGRESAWVHPTHSSVGPALRRLHERAGLSMREDRPFSGFALVPDDRSGAAWSPLADRMSCVARLSTSEPVLEEYGTGAWRAVCPRRELALMMVPRVAGSRVKPVVVETTYDLRWLTQPSETAWSPALRGGTRLRWEGGCAHTWFSPWARSCIGRLLRGGVPSCASPPSTTARRHLSSSRARAMTTRLGV